MQVWPADELVFQFVEKVKTKHHLPRLEEAEIAIEFNDSKAFIREGFNWGKTSKFSASARNWQPQDKRYNFLITLPIDGWNLLSEGQKEAWLDLRISCMQVEFIPQTAVENGKKKTIKDNWGRTLYTDQLKLDDEGNPKWKVVKVDLPIFQDNVERYGCWCQDLIDLKSAIKNADLGKAVKTDIKIEELNDTTV